jgi:hypothetical protein
MYNSMFIHNSAGYGGALYLLGVEANPANHPYRFINNTFYENEADNSGGAILSDYGDPLLLNNILYANSAPVGQEIRIMNGSAFLAYNDIDTNDIYGNFTAGSGNFHGNPGFVDTLCHIDVESPCHNTGIESYELNGIIYSSPDHDFEGDERPGPHCYLVDVGADEVEYDCVGIEEPENQNSKPNIQIWPNPTSGIFNLQFTIYDLQSISVAIHDMHGREVMRVLDKMLPAGEHEVQADLSGLPEGVYFCKLAVGSWQLAVKKVIVVR